MRQVAMQPDVGRRTLEIEVRQDAGQVNLDT